MEFFSESMIGDAVVGEIIGADLFGAVGGTDLFAAQVGDVAGRFDLLDLIEFRAEDVHRFLAVRVLRTFFAGGDDDTGRFMEDAHGGLHFVHVLSARVRRRAKR